MKNADQSEDWRVSETEELGSEKEDEVGKENTVETQRKTVIGPELVVDDESAGERLEMATEAEKSREVEGHEKAGREEERAINDAGGVHCSNAVGNVHEGDVNDNRSMSGIGNSEEEGEINEEIEEINKEGPTAESWEREGESLELVVDLGQIGPRNEKDMEMWQNYLRQKEESQKVGQRNGPKRRKESLKNQKSTRKLKTGKKTKKKEKHGEKGISSGENSGKPGGNEQENMREVEDMVAQPQEQRGAEYETDEEDEEEEDAYTIRKKAREEAEETWRLNKELGLYAENDGAVIQILYEEQLQKKKNRVRAVSKPKKKGKPQNSGVVLTLDE